MGAPNRHLEKYLTGANLGLGRHFIDVALVPHFTDEYMRVKASQ